MQLLLSSEAAFIDSLPSSKCQIEITITTNDFNGMERSRYRMWRFFHDEDLRGMENIDAVGFLVESMQYSSSIPSDGCLIFILTISL